MSSDQFFYYIAAPTNMVMCAIMVHTGDYAVAVFNGLTALFCMSTPPRS